MLHVLTHNILPVFFILALGFFMGRTRTASQDEARAINRIAFLVLQPPLLLMLLTGLDLETVRLDAILIYAACELVCFLVSFALARLVFRCPLPEAWILGMSVVFVNSLLYIWPIATLIYGETGALPVSAIVAFDASLMFAFFIISTDLITGRGKSGGALRRLVRNPVLVTIVVSVLINLSGATVPEPVLTAARFAGAGAAPMTLFALGVVLSSHPIRPNATVAGISAMKLAVFPTLVWIAFATLSPGNPWSDLFTMNAAGPAGAMSFALAMVYGLPTRNIAPVIVWTSVLSLVSLAWLA